MLHSNEGLAGHDSDGMSSDGQVIVQSFPNFPYIFFMRIYPEIHSRTRPWADRALPYLTLPLPRAAGVRSSSARHRRSHGGVLAKIAMAVKADNGGLVHATQRLPSQTMSGAAPAFQAGIHEGGTRLFWNYRKYRRSTTTTQRR